MYWFCFSYFHFLRLSIPSPWLVNWQGHRESNPGLKTRNLQCYPLHHAPLNATQAEVPGLEPGSRDSKSLMLSTTPYLQTALQKTAIAHVFDTHAATLPKPGSVALTAKTEGPLQRKLVVEFWSPHIAHLSGSSNGMHIYRKSVSVYGCFPES